MPRPPSRSAGGQGSSHRGGWGRPPVHSRSRVSVFLMNSLSLIGVLARGLGSSSRPPQRPPPALAVRLPPSSARHARHAHDAHHTCTRHLPPPSVALFRRRTFSRLKILLNLDIIDSGEKWRVNDACQNGPISARLSPSAGQVTVGTRSHGGVSIFYFNLFYYLLLWMHGVHFRSIYIVWSQLRLFSGSFKRDIPHEHLKVR